jgi:hypothetical protein
MIGHLSEDCRGETRIHRSAGSAASGSKRAGTNTVERAARRRDHRFTCSGQAARRPHATVCRACIWCRSAKILTLRSDRTGVDRATSIAFAGAGDDGFTRAREAAGLLSLLVCAGARPICPDVRQRSLIGACASQRALLSPLDRWHARTPRRAPPISGEPGSREHNRALRYRSRGGDRAPVLAVPA